MQANKLGAYQKLMMTYNFYQNHTLEKEEDIIPPFLFI